ncbi:MAG: hypothetical protein AB7J40_01680 [Candidatus Altimarinota bacterium]
MRAVEDHLKGGSAEQCPHHTQGFGKLLIRQEDALSLVVLRHRMTEDHKPVRRPGQVFSPERDLRAKVQKILGQAFQSIEGGLGDVPDAHRFHLLPDGPERSPESPQVEGALELPIAGIRNLLEGLKAL